MSTLACERSHRRHDLGELAKVAGGEGHQVVGDLLAPLAREAPDDAEVEKADAPVRREP